MKTFLAIALVPCLFGCQPASAPDATALATTPAIDSAQQAAPTASSEVRYVAASDAQEPGENPPALRPSYDACISASGGVTPSMRDCIDAEYRFQDMRLNNAYETLLATLCGKEGKELRDAQRHWIAKRDEQCAYDPESGQAGGLDAYECRLEMTASRAAELESQ